MAFLLSATARLLGIASTKPADTPRKGQGSSAHELDVYFLSGSKVTTLQVDDAWTGLDVKAALQPFLPRRSYIAAVASGVQILGDTLTVGELRLAPGSVLQVAVRAYDYFVEGAGVPEVNGGHLRKDELMNDAPCYRNEAGVLLFRYVMRHGSPFWYFSQEGQNVNSSAFDYFRVKTTEMLPPRTGWTSLGCQLGRGEEPIVIGCQEEATDTAGSPSAHSRPPVSPGACDQASATSSTCMSPVSFTHEEKAAAPRALEVYLLSGAKLTTLRATDAWTCREVKAALQPLLPAGSCIGGVLCGAQALVGSATLGQLEAVENSTLQVTVHGYDYFVKGAGAPEVNGGYVRKEEMMNGAPCYRNEEGVLLFRYKNGSWYFSQEGQNLDSSAFDYFRARTTKLRPPHTGWVTCPLGRDKSEPTVYWHDGEAEEPEADHATGEAEEPEADHAAGEAEQPQ